MMDGWMCVWWYRAERLETSCMKHCHTGSAPGVMVWGAIGLLYHSYLVRITGTLNSQSSTSVRCWSLVVLNPLGIPGLIYQQDSASPHVACNIQRYLDSHHVSLLLWSACSLDLSPTEHICTMAELIFVSSLHGYRYPEHTSVVSLLPIMAT